ncbi:MAG: hypothetical protein AAGI70_08555 [Pseudomonadota bacterium]
MADEEVPILPDQVPGAQHPRETAQFFGQAAAEKAFLAAGRTWFPSPARPLQERRGINATPLRAKGAAHV